MSKVEELLAKYNPNGVDNIPLWELTAWDKKFNAVDKSMQKKVIKYKYYLAKDLDALVDDTGDIRILYTNEKVAYTSEEKCNGNICEGEIVAIPWGGTPTVKYYNGKFVTGDNRIATSLDTKILNNKYLFYWMISQLGTIADFYRGAGIQHPSMSSVLSMEIPLPHIKVQEEIVKILDSFTNLIDSLNEELSLRQKQFEYYREKLLTFDKNAHKKRIIDLLIQPITDGPHETPTFVEKGIPFISAEAIVDNKINFSKKRGFISNEYNDLCCKKYKPKVGDVYMVKSGSTVGKVAILEDKMQFNIWSPLAALRVNDSCLPKYLYYLLLSRNIQEQIKQKCSKGSQPNLSMRVLERFEINVVNYRIQQSIVEKLDAFESLISSLKEEIALRQKQYEYYREKLLTFD